jgi:transposase InsO family protein
MFKELFRGGYFWEGMKKDCVRKGKRCGKCLRFNVGKRGFHPLRPINALMPMDLVMIDIAGKFKISGGGFVFVLVVVDVASRYVWLREMRTKTTSEIVGVLVRLFCEFGFPAVVQSDNEATLVSKMMGRLGAQAGYEVRNSVEYNPEQMGSVERMIREVKAVVHKWCEGKVSSWVGFLGPVQRGLNDRVVRRTKSSPFCVMFGRRGKEKSGLRTWTS